MEKNTNNYIAVAYKLYITEKGNAKLVEEATDEKPFLFISGFGETLEGFERETSRLEKGDEFCFTLTKEEAYGDFLEEHVIDLDRSIFTINGHFDHENIFRGAMVPMLNEDGNRLFGQVLDITEDKVKMDFNHPLAGNELTFKGHIVEKREATNEEIQAMVNRMSGESCGCGCGGDCSCGGGCDGHHDHNHGDHHCGCGHCH